MNAIKFDFKGFRILLKGNKYPFPIETWEYENEEDLRTLDQLNFNLANLHTEYENHTRSGLVGHINLSEKMYNSMFSIALRSLQRLRQEFKGNEVTLLYQDTPIKPLAELADDTVGVYSNQSV